MIAFFGPKWHWNTRFWPKKNYNFNKNLPKSVCFDSGIRHFDATKPQNRPLTPLMIGVGVRRFDRICALLQRIPPCKKVLFWKKSIYEVLILSRRYIHVIRFCMCSEQMRLWITLIHSSFFVTFIRLIDLCEHM